MARINPRKRSYIDRTHDKSVYERRRERLDEWRRIRLLKNDDVIDDVDPLDAFMEQLKPQVPLNTNVEMNNDNDGDNDGDDDGGGGERFYDDDGILDESDWRRTGSNAMSWLQKQAAIKKKELPVVDHASMEYESFRKNFYIESKEISGMSKEEVNEYRMKELEGVKLRGKDVPKPIKKWTQCGLPRKILDTIEKQRYKAPFPIQAQAIPIIMSGRDCIGCAKTGSGKTLAFVLPMLRHVLDQRHLEQNEGPIALILAPTRELAVQIFSEVKKFVKNLNLRCCAVYGGAAMGEQINHLRSGAEIVVATPGRMIDVLCANGGRVTNLARCTYVVLDEADRMFDMGFAPQIMMIVNNVRPQRQTVMFSATFPKPVELLAKRALRRPIEVIIGGRSQATGTVNQVIEVRDKTSKFRRLLEILGQWYQKGLILIFVDTQDRVDRMYQQLAEAGYPALSMHGGMDQSDRDYTIMDFRNHLKTILVATSVLSRGLDIKDLILVVNYNAPNHYENYVHRIGRTGRAGRNGTAITFVTEEDAQITPDLVKGLEKSGQKPPDELVALRDDFMRRVEAGEVQYYGGGGYSGKGFKFDEEEAKESLRQRQREMIAYGEGDELVIDLDERGASDDDEGMDDDDDRATSAPNALVAIRTPKSRGSANKQVSSSAMSDDATAILEVDPLKAQIAAAMRVAQLSSKAMTKAATTEGEITEEAVEQAKKAVEGVISKMKRDETKRLAQLARAKMQNMFAPPSGVSVVNHGNGQAFTDRIEINDYPKQARLKLMKRGTLDDILEETECLITMKGTYVPLHRPTPRGETKLYLSIDGPSANAVMKTKNEIRRILEEVSLSMPVERSSRYSVI